MYKHLVEEEDVFQGTLPQYWSSVGIAKFHAGCYSTTGWRWESCREGFASCFLSDIQTIFIGAKPNHQKKIIEFITEFEEKLRLKNSDRLRFVVFKNTNVLKIKVSKFWRQRATHRSLLTILLRAPIRVNKSSYNDVMKYHYLKRTEKAIKQFIKFRGKIQKINCWGWVSTFSRKDSHNLIKAA